MSKTIKYRRQVYLFLLLTGFVSFMMSFAVNNIVVWLLLAFFISDYLKNIINKVRKAFRNPIVWCCLLLFLVQILGVFYSDNTSQAWDRVLSMSPLAFLPIILLSEPLEKNDRDRILQILKFLVPLLFIGLLIYHLVIDQRALSTFVHFRVVDGLGMSQFYLSFLVMIPFLSALDGLRKKDQIIVNLIILIFSTAILILFKNLTSLLFLLIVWIVIMFRLFAQSSPGKAFILLVGGIFLIALSFQIPIIKSRLHFLQKTTDFDIETITTKNRFTHTKNTLEHRLFIDYLAIEEIQNSFPVGVGTGDIQDVLNQAYENVGFKSGIKNKYNAHNQYLEEWLKTGIFGGIMFFVLLFFLFRKASLNDPHYTFLMLFFVTACLFESYLNRQHGVFILGFILCFFIKEGKRISQ